MNILKKHSLAGNGPNIGENQEKQNVEPFFCFFCTTIFQPCNFFQTRISNPLKIPKFELLNRVYNPTLFNILHFRASHPEALKWAEAMLDETKNVETKKELFKAAIVKQTQVMKENIFGEGIDIPLLGIKNACQEIWPEQKFQLFEDATFSNAMNFKLSTSQVNYILS